MKELPRRGELWWCEPPSIGRRPVGVLVQRMGTLSGARMQEVCAALGVATECS